MADEKDTSVRVAVRIRPQSAREKIDACRVCTFVTPTEPQIAIGKDKRFTYDYVFDIPSTQEQIYDKCVKRLVNGCFNGYNATVLAYGQTGSGKTYTMGTGFDISKSDEQIGIIPRAVNHLFREIDARTSKAVEEGLPKPEFAVTAQFMELYNEEIKDLFDVSKGSLAGNAKIQIHGDNSGNIYAVGVTSKPVNSSKELIKCLQEGALNRTTASTRMNAQSSRSHAIFSVHLKQTRAVRMKMENKSPTSEDGEDKSEEDSNAPLEYETLTAKFHFTDLAGSERLKRTGATGERAKEGIAINCGLLALGNVISALGDPDKTGNFVPYRDSKLTRLLQDSLGGNSQTLMIACVSPSDSDFMETVNTLTYANRARNIQNKVMLNQDKASQQVQALRQQIMTLQLELTEYKTGKRVAGEESYNDMYQENTMLKEENEHLRMRVKAIQEKSSVQMDELTKLKALQACGNLANGVDAEGGGLETIIENYIKETESLRSKLLESEAMCSNLRRRSTCAPMSPFASRVTPTPVPMSGSRIFESPSAAEIPILNLARKDIEELRMKKTALELKALSRKDEKDEIPEEEDGDDGAESQDEAKEEFDEEEDDELNLSDSDNDEEEDEEERKNIVQKDLAALTFEIDLKQNLIDELEAQKKRMDSLRHQYESKLLQMETKIRATEEERDRMLSNFQNRNQKDEEKKIKVQYEKKLDNMKKQLGKLKDAKKTHDKAVKEQTKYQQQLKKLKGELDQMKTAKVRLMKEMREQQKKGKQQDTQRVKEISQLRKEGRKKESQIRTLSSKNQLKDRLVQRKREEIEMLKKQMAVKFGTGRRKLVTKSHTIGHGDRTVRGSKDKKHDRSRSSEYSSKQAKLKWQKIETRISNVVMQREMITHMEKQMDRLMKQRESARRDIQKAERRKTKYKAIGNEVPSDLKTEIGSLDDTIEFTNYQIEEIQSEILQVTESLESDSFMSSLLDTCTMSEYRYIVDHILAMAVNKSAMVLVSQNKIAELQARLEGELETSKHAQELMRYIVEEQTNLAPEITELIKTSGFDDESDTDSSPERAPSFNGFIQPEQKDLRVKARRRTATPQELLHGITTEKSPTALKPELSPIVSGDSPQLGDGNATFCINNEAEKLTSTPDVGEPFGTNRRATFCKQEPPDTLPVNSTFTVADSSSPVAADNGGARPKGSVSPLVNGNQGYPQHDFARPITPTSSKATSSKDLPPDVFARLTKFSLSSPRVNRGSMKEVHGKAGTPRASYLECTQIAEGHSKPVLCLHATEHLLFSGSKDRTAKIWNLVTGQEFETLNGHPNNVNAIHRCPISGLIFTVSLCYVKVWDIRTKAKCIKVISSSGQILSPASFLGTMGRTNRMPDNEWQISDLALSRDSKLLYTAAGNTVKIWDLNKYGVVGKLVGHAGPVITLKVPDTKTDCVITGSKDHYVKSFHIPDSLGTIQPTVTLNPPHMDGVESLATSISHNALFSGSRDKSIKKWELGSKNLLKSEYQAHTSWVCTLDTVKISNEEMLISGGRDGTVKIWDIDSLVAIDDIKAHSDTINHIASNGDFVYTASNDRFVKIWNVRGLSKIRRLEAHTEEAICEGIL